MASIEDSLSEIVKRYQADPSSNKLKSSEQSLLSAVRINANETAIIENQLV